MNSLNAPLIEENHPKEDAFELNYSRGIEFYEKYLGLTQDELFVEYEDNINSYRALSFEYLEKYLMLPGSQEQQIKKIKAALILSKICDESHQGKGCEYYFYIAIDRVRRYLGEDFLNTVYGKEITEMYLSKINPDFKDIFDALSFKSSGPLLRLNILASSNERRAEQTQEEQNFKTKIGSAKDYSDLSVLERIQDILGPIRLQIISEDSGETVVRHGFRSLDGVVGESPPSSTWYTTVKIFDKPKKYAVSIDRGSNEGMNQFDRYQLGTTIKSMIDIYIKKREWKFFINVIDNTDTLALYERERKLPAAPNDYRQFLNSVIQRYVNPLEFHESREDPQYVDNLLKAIDICRHVTLGDTENLAQKIDHILGGKIQRRVLQMVKTILASRSETMNGSGYPFGLSKKRIPLESRIYSIIRAYEALGSVVKPKQVATTMRDWTNEGGGYFDSDISSIFAECVNEEGLLPKSNSMPIKLRPVSKRREHVYTEHWNTWNAISIIILEIEEIYNNGRGLEADISVQRAMLLKVSRLKKKLRKLINTRKHIVLSRHSETDGNPDLPGTNDELLTQKGKKDSQSKGEHLAGLRFKILTSPIIRVRQTAAIICQKVRGCIQKIVPIQIDNSYVIPACLSCPGVTAETSIENLRKEIDNGLYDSLLGKVCIKDSEPNDSPETTENTQRLQKFLIDLISSPEESTHLIITHKDSAQLIVLWLKNLFDQNSLAGTKKSIEENILYECFFEGESMVEPGEIRPNTLLFSLTDWKILVDAINLLAQAVFKEPFCKRNEGRVNLIALHDSFLDWMDEKSEKSPRKFSLFIEGLGSNTATAHIIEILKLAGILDQNFMVDKPIRPI